MPVDFGGLFQFAAPPLTGGQWLVHGLLDVGMASASSEGNSLHKLLVDAERPWGKPDESLRLSFVCNPLTWLMFHHLSPMQNLPYDFIDLLPAGNFEAFVHQYLSACPGAITRLFDQYESQVIQRIEDQPFAFAEFAESIGIPDAFVQKMKARPCTGNGTPFCSSWLRTELRRVDEKIFDLYDYW